MYENITKIDITVPSIKEIINNLAFYEYYKDYVV